MDIFRTLNPFWSLLHSADPIVDGEMADCAFLKNSNPSDDQYVFLALMFGSSA